MDMDMQTVWNRLDQMEKLVISQAREIDNLKRTVKAISHVYQHNQANKNDNILRTQNLLSRPSLFRQSFIANNIIANNDSAINPTQPITSQPSLQPLMNSFVHPQSAIPPVTIRPNANTPANSISSLAQSTLAASQENQKMSQNWLDLLNNENRPAPNIRWSSFAGHSTPNTNDISARSGFRQYLSNQNSGNFPSRLNEDDLEELSKRHEHQSFVEKLNCLLSSPLPTRDEDGYRQYRESSSSSDMGDDKHHDNHTERETQQVQPTSTVDDELESTENVRKSPVHTTSTELRKSLLDDNLKDYIVGECEIYSDGKKQEISGDEDWPEYTYITFVKPDSETSQLWRPIKDPRKSQKRAKRLHHKQNDPLTHLDQNQNTPNLPVELVNIIKNSPF